MKKLAHYLRMSRRASTISFLVSVALTGAAYMLQSNEVFTLAIAAMAVTTVFMICKKIIKKHLQDSMQEALTGVVDVTTKGEDRCGFRVKRRRNFLYEVKIYDDVDNKHEIRETIKALVEDSTIKAKVEIKYSGLKGLVEDVFLLN